MVFDYFDKYTFICEMYVEEVDEIKELVLNFFPFDNAVQVIDTSRGVQMLRRQQMPSLNLHMLQIGNIINIFEKLLLIKECTPLTQRLVFKNVESTFVMIKPMPQKDLGKITSFVELQGFRLIQARICHLTKDIAVELYKNVVLDIAALVIDYVTSGTVLAMEVSGPHAIKRFRQCLGATDPREAAPGTLRSYYGFDKLLNCAHGASNEQEVKEAVEGLFGVKDGVYNTPLTATLADCTCCVIKPHAIVDGHFGSIIDHITSGGHFYISSLASFNISIKNAEEFYEVYKGVYSEYQAMAVQLASGVCVAMEIKAVDPANNATVVSDFRKLCGPVDPDVCRQIYPDSIRAHYGKSRVENAVHCTDLAEDGVTEVEYFFWHIAKSIKNK